MDTFCVKSFEEAATISWPEGWVCILRRPCTPDDIVAALWRLTPHEERFMHTGVGLRHIISVDPTSLLVRHPDGALEIFPLGSYYDIYVPRAKEPEP